MVIIDDLEKLVKKPAEGQISYSKGRREDTYESIRQLIDDIDSMRYVLFLLCFDRELMDNESTGLKSYQALWMRVQNEVVSFRFNRFADIVDMDRYGDEFSNEDIIMEMSGKLSNVLLKAGERAEPVSLEQAKLLKERAVFGKLGIPYLVNRLTAEGGREGV